MRYLTNEMIAKLNYAYHHEYSNSLFYDYIASYLNVMGFDNLSDFWADWSGEEKKHSQWVKEFLQDLNIPLSPASLENFDYDLNKGLIEFVNITLDREDKTTQLYHDILDVALELENSGLLVQFANKMLIEQTEETNKALTIKDKVSNIGDDKALLQIFNNTFEIEN
jgi:ferritin